MREHCYTLDTPAAAARLHRAPLARAARVKAGVQPELRVVIVGAGTTGVKKGTLVSLGGELRVSGLGAKLAYTGLYEAHLVF